MRPCRELAGLQELTSGDNRMVSKVALVMLSLLEEVHRLVVEGRSNLVHPLLVYGEGAGEEEEEGDNCVSVGKMLPHLQQLLCFVEHCRDVVNNILQQMAVLLGPNSVVKVVLYSFTVLSVGEVSHGLVVAGGRSEAVRRLGVSG